MGLSNTLAAAKVENNLARRDALLDELRALASAHPDESEMRMWYGLGLYNALLHAKDERDSNRHNALVKEIRGLTPASRPGSEEPTRA